MTVRDLHHLFGDKIPNCRCGMQNMMSQQRRGFLSFSLLTIVEQFAVLVFCCGDPSCEQQLQTNISIAVGIEAMNNLERMWAISRLVQTGMKLCI